MEEKIQWKYIDGYSGLFQVSNTGFIRKILPFGKFKLMTRCEKKGAGHLFVGLSNNGYRKMHYVHTLVAEAFLSHLDIENCVIHIDTDKNNCNANNLLCCRREEIRTINKKQRFALKTQHKSTKLYKPQLREIEKYIKDYKFQITRKLSIQYDVSFDTINNLM